jgi:hypothetical protein
MTDQAKEYKPDPRGGLWLDFGDGRGRIHESELTGAEREHAGLPILAPQPETDEESTISESSNV